MDLNLLLHRNRLALKRQEEAASDEERRAFREFARDYAGQAQSTLMKISEPGVESKRLARSSLRRDPKTDGQL